MNIKDLETFLENKYNIELHLYEKRDTIILSSIVVPKENRKSGVGTAAMNDIIEYADRNGKEIRLTPDIGIGGTSVNRLRKFYRRFGFKKNSDYR